MGFPSEPIAVDHLHNNLSSCTYLAYFSVWFQYRSESQYVH